METKGNGDGQGDVLNSTIILIKWCIKYMEIFSKKNKGRKWSPISLLH